MVSQMALSVEHEHANDWPLSELPELPLRKSTPAEIKAKKESDQLYWEEQEAIDAYLASVETEERSARDEADVLEQHRLDNEQRCKPLAAPRTVADQAESVLSHVLRLPELFATARHSLTASHFRNSGRWDLAEVWEAAQELVTEHGVEVMRSDNWADLLERAVKRKGQSAHVNRRIFGGLPGGELSLFERTFGLPATAYSLGSGQTQFDDFVFLAQVGRPLRDVLNRVQSGEILPGAATEKIQAIMKRHGGAGGKPLFMTPAEFATTDFKIDWLVPKVLVAGQPCIVGGPSKSLKTSIMIDLAVSLGAGGGTKFLDKFPVENPGKKIGFISGESGPATIKETFQRVCRVRGLTLEETNVHPEFRLPKLGQSKEVQHLASQIRRHGLQVIVIDPIYLSLLAGNKTAKAPNLFDMGPLLADLTEACLEAGATPILVHHTVKHLSLEKADGMYLPLEREDLAQSGFAEFARQWMLINRRTPYQDGTGEHELWLRIGGSAGFGSLSGVDIKEGVIQEDFTGRHWSVTVHDKDELDRVNAVQKAKVQVLKDAQKDQELRTRLLEAMQLFPDGETMTAIEKAARISSNKSHSYLFHQLAMEGRIQPTKVLKRAGRGTRPENGFKLTNPFAAPPSPFSGSTAGISP